MKTKSTFEMVAMIIKAQPHFAPSLRAAKASYATAFADSFALDNPKFKRDVFLKACGIVLDPAKFPVQDATFE